MSKPLLLYSNRDFENLKKVGLIHKKVQYAILDVLKVGATGILLEKVAKEILDREGAKSAFFKFKSFPNYICVSVNNEILHGIPTRRKFKNGDLVKIDIGVLYQGYIVDGAFSVVVASKEYKAKLKESEAYDLAQTTYQALRNAIQMLSTKNYLSDFAKIFYNLAKRKNYYLIKNYMGHGVGKSLHEEPRIPNSPNSTNYINWKIKNGMSLAIEPMLYNQFVELEIGKDNWTVQSINKKALSAHFEETVFVFKNKLVSITKNEKLNEDSLIVC